MKEGELTEHQLSRFRTAVEHQMKVSPMQKPDVVVVDEDSVSDEGHIVNLDLLTCTCHDFSFNCEDGQYCKHIWRAVLTHHRMIDWP